MNTPVIQIVHQGRVHTFSNIPPEKTLIELIRENMNLFGVKEACAGGDCGACAVVLGKKGTQGLSYSAVNSCIRLAHSVHGMALWTSQDISSPPHSAHPVQQAMRQAHASQCGFCTPGFAMSFFEMYQKKIMLQKEVSQQDVEHQLSGNLCRCTGYRPILEAGLNLQHDPEHDIDEMSVLNLLKQISPRQNTEQSTYALPQTTQELLQLRSANSKSQLVAGCTDVGLWVNKQHQKFGQVIDLTQVASLQHITQDDKTLTIGAGVSLEDAFDALTQERTELKTYCHRFAGLLVRRSGTLGGNIANGSPIGDSMPMLIALRASIILSRWDGEKVIHRQIQLEDFYKAYRVKDLAPEEVLTQIVIPRPHAGEWVRAYKVSKRFEDDISAVALSIAKTTDDQGRLTDISIGVGGVAAVPARARQAELAIIAHGWTPAGIEAAQNAIKETFTPLSDLRASKAYRAHMLNNLLQRAWIESSPNIEPTLQELS